MKLFFKVWATIFIFVGIISFTGCEKDKDFKKEVEQNKIENNQNKKSSNYLYSATKSIVNKSSTLQIDYIIKTDKESLLNTELIFEPVYKTNTLSENNTIYILDENKENFEKAEISIELKNINLPNGAVGFSVSKGSNSSYGTTSGTMEILGYKYQGVYKGEVKMEKEKAGRSRVYAKIGVLWTTSSWFYDNVRNTLKHKNETLSKSYSDFYKMRVYAKFKHCDAKITMYF